MTDIQENLVTVRSRIEAAALVAGRCTGDVTLVAVSKRHPKESIRKAYAAGQRHFGENYAQELREKAEALSDLPGIHWHFIGHLQRNKTKYVVPSVHTVETVDSIRLIEELEKQASHAKREVRCLIQVNVGKEEQKYGCEKGETPMLLKAIARAKWLTPFGLMTIPPFDLEAEETRKYFVELARLRETLGGAEQLPHLSMGMSNDFEVAIEEGATFVRVGTAIFGQRPY